MNSPVIILSMVFVTHSNALSRVCSVISVMNFIILDEGHIDLESHMTFNGLKRKVLKQAHLRLWLVLVFLRVDLMEYVEGIDMEGLFRAILYYYKVKNLLNSDTFVDKCFDYFGNIRLCNGSE